MNYIALFYTIKIIQNITKNELQTGKKNTKREIFKKKIGQNLSNYKSTGLDKFY